MTDKERLAYAITLDTAQLETSSKRVSDTFKGMGNNIDSESDRISNSMKKIGTAAATYFTVTSLNSFAQSVIRVRGEIEALEISFATLLGSKEKAKEFFGEIKEFAVTTPMTLDVLAKGAQTMLGFGISAEKVMPLLRQIGDISMGNADKFSSLTLAFSQASSTGKLMGQDFLQMVNAGFNPLNQLAQATGKSVSQLKDEMSEGKIKVEELELAFATATKEGGMFHGMLEKQSKGINGALSNLQGAWDDMLNDIGNKQQSVFVSGVNMLTEMVQNYEVYANTLMTVAAAYGSYKAALMAVWVIEKARNLSDSIRLIMMFRKELGLLTAAQQAFNITAWANPYVLLAAAILGVIAALVIWTDNTSEAEQAQNKLNESKDRFKQQLEDERAEIEKCISIVQDKTETDYAQLAAYEKLKNLCPAITEAYTQEELAVAKLSDTKKMLNEVQDEKTYQNMVSELHKYQSVLDDVIAASGNWSKLSKENADIVRNEYGTGLLKNKIDDIQAYVEELQNVVNETNRLRKEAEYNALPLEKKLELAIDERDSIQQEFDRVKKELESKQKETQDKFGFWNMDIFLKFRFHNLQSNLKQANSKVDNLQSQQQAITTYGDDFKAAKEQWQKTKSELDKISTDRSKYTTEQYRKAKEDYDNAEKAYKDLGGEVQKKSKSDTIKEQKKLLQEIAEQRKGLLLKSSEAEISAMRDGLTKRLAEIENQRQQTIAAIDKEQAQLEQKLKKVGKTLSNDDLQGFKNRRDSANNAATNEKREIEEENAEYIKGLYENLGDVFLSEEERKINAIRRTYREQRKQLGKDLAGGDISQDQYNELTTGINKAEAKEMEDYWLSTYGNYYQKREVLQEEWETRLAIIPAKYQAEANRLYLEELSKLDIDKFKKSINWESVFGNLGEQSLSSLSHTLEQVKTMFETNKSNMSVTEIKDMQEAIREMENEIANRNPFTGLHKSLKDIAASKDEIVAMLAEYKDAQVELTGAQEEYNLALQAKQELDAQVNDGTTSEDTEEYVQTVTNLTNATIRLTSAEQRSQKAEQGVLSARNGLTASYKSFATQLGRVKGVIDDVGGHAKNLANVFSDDIGDGIEKALDFMDEIFDATSNVISAIGDVGKNVADAMSSTVSATSTGMQASATAAATSISTVEKASVILTVISAALQVATAIANLFNSDDKKQEEIERLQERIDQLQWELDNAEAIRLQKNTGDALERLKKIVSDTTNEVLKLRIGNELMYSDWHRMVGKAVYQSEIYKKSIEKLADAYGALSYTADKALGADKYASSRSQLENLAEQQLVLQKQINAEADKKDSDNGKIQELKREIQELGEEMVTIINEMVEDIIGGSASDIAEQLGDAFFEAFRNGEDAAKAWKDTVDDIVSDIVKRMLVTELLEKPMGAIFDKYKKRWFGDDGSFLGIDAVTNSMTDFAGELNGLVNVFQIGMEGLPDELKEIILGNAEEQREGTQKGIATASQESVDENNARLTTIQGHTYTLSQGMVELNRTSNAILEKVTDIEKHTSDANDKLDDMGKDIKKMKGSMDDISTKGIKLKS